VLTSYLDGKKVWASDVNDRSALYKDEIGQSMILVKGCYKIHHFRHYPSEESHFDTEAETYEHMMGKKFIYDNFINDFPDTEVEKVFMNIMRKGDVVIPELKINFEVQCSSISVDEMLNRENDWKKIGFQVCWIFGCKKYMNNVTRFIKKLVNRGVRDISLDNEGKYLDDFEKVEVSCIKLKEPEVYVENEHNLGFVYYFDVNENCIFRCLYSKIETYQPQYLVSCESQFYPYTKQLYVTGGEYKSLKKEKYMNKIKIDDLKSVLSDYRYYHMSTKEISNPQSSLTFKEISNFFKDVNI
jgi:hypothetical protein